MKIGYYAVEAGNGTTGVGQYGRTLLRDLSVLHPENRYVAYTLSVDRERWADAGESPALDLRPRMPRDLPGIMDDEFDLFHGLSDWLPESARVPMIATVHDLIAVEWQEGWPAHMREMQEDRIRAGIAHATRIQVPSEATRARLEVLGVAREKIDVTWQSCLPRFREPVSAEARAQVRARWKMPERFVVHVGTLMAWKNAAALVRAFARLPERHRDVGLLIAGASGMRYGWDVRDLAKPLGDRVRMTEFVKSRDLPAVYAEAACVAQPALAEGFCIPVLEALSVGAIVVTSDRSAPREVGGPAAILVDPTSEDAILEGLVTALDGSMNEKLRAAAPAHLARFSPEAVTERVIASYRAAL